MPKYYFECKMCFTKVHKYTSPDVEHIDCECGNSMNRLMPTIKDQTEVREIIDPFLNKTHLKDQDSIISKRKEQHYWEVEVPRLVEKYSLETCLEQKWLIYNDKGELVINKPPSKR
jgi:hypothetical protein